jgi:uncharacterized membrane protein YphA (DoxX/SURF4 family)
MSEKPTNLVRITTLGSWAILLGIHIASIPVPEEAAIWWVVGIILSLIGVIAGVLTALGTKIWRKAVIIAAILFIAMFALHFGTLVEDEMSIWKKNVLYASYTIIEDTWKIFWYLITQKAFLQAFVHAYVCVIMPTTQSVILVTVFRSVEKRRLTNG